METSHNIRDLTVFKLLTMDNRSRKGRHNETLWVPGVPRTVEGTGGLCTEGWIHAYRDPLVGEFLNPVHANLKEPYTVWQCVANGRMLQEWDKIGVSQLEIVKELDPVYPSSTQRVAFGILCALGGNPSPKWRKWARRGLSNTDRTEEEAVGAEAAAETGAAWAARGAVWAARGAEAVTRAAAWAAAAEIERTLVGCSRKALSF